MYRPHQKFSGEANFVFQGKEGGWFPLKSQVINPDSGQIILDDLGDLYAGLQISNSNPNNITFYHSFLSEKIKKDDQFLTPLPYGILDYNRSQNTYRIGPQEKLYGNIYRGTVVTLESNRITTNGFFKNFPYNFPRGTVDMKLSGSWSQDLTTNRISSDLVMGLDLKIIPKQALLILFDQFPRSADKVMYQKFKKRLFQESVAELLDLRGNTEPLTQAFVRSVNDASTSQDIGLARELPYSLLLSGINFKQDQNILYSSGQVGLIGIDGNVVNQMVNAKITYQMNGGNSSDNLIIYLEKDPDSWVFFRFDGYGITSISTFPVYNRIILKNGFKGSRVQLVNQNEVQYFLDDFDRNYPNN